MAYSKERRAAVIAKMLPPCMAIPVLSRQEGISEATLYKSRGEARAQRYLGPNAGDAPAGWTSRDKFAAVVETALLNSEALAAYCCERGLYPEQIATWRAVCRRHSNQGSGRKS